MESMCYLKMKTRLRGNKYWQLLCFLRNEIVAMEDKLWDKVWYFRSGYVCFKTWISTAESESRIVDKLTSYDEKSAS
jgi:hypothetical protein